MTKLLAQAKFLAVRAGVRYWEDGSLNGVEDTSGEMPLRQGDAWQPVIELDTGRVLNWPEGSVADIHYKVCDDGEYWLLDESKQQILKWNGFYVPDDLLAVGTNGYGDYVIMKIGADGLIENWRRPALDEDLWDPV